MPPPLPPQSSKPETKKSQSSKIVPSDHDQSEKRRENYQAKLSPSSPKGGLKKRSAFEDLTNASQSQSAQPKKEANKGVIKDVPKKINRNTHALGVAKHNDMNIKRYKLEPSPVVDSTTLVPNVMEKPLILEISSISKTPTTEEAPLFKKPLVLKEEPTTEETTLIKKSLSLKKYTNNREMSLSEGPLSLQEETDNDDEFVIEQATFRNKHKTEEAAITKRTLSLKKEMCVYQGKQSCWEESYALQDISVEEDSFFMEPMNFRKKPKTGESPPTKKMLSVKKCTSQGKRSHFKPLVLQKTISGEESLTKELSSFKKEPTTDEEFFFQESSMLQQKHTTQGEVDLLKKPWALQGNSDSEDNSVMEVASFKKKHTTKKSNPIKMSSPLKKKKCTSQGKRSHFKPLVLQKTISGEESLTNELLSFKKKPTTKEESLFQEPSALQEQNTTQEEVSTLKKPLALQKSTEEESLFKQALAFKKHTTEEATPTKKPLPLKKQQHTIQGTMSHLKKPLVLQKTTFGEKSLIKESLSSKEEKVSLEKKKCATQVISVCQEMLDLQDVFGKDKNSFFTEPVSFKKNPTTEEAVLTKTQLSLKKKQITQGKVFPLKKPLVLEKTILEEESLSKKLLPFKNKTTTQEEFLFQEPPALKEKHTTLQELSLSKKPLALQEKTTTKEESYIKEPLSLKEKPTTEEEFLFQELFSLHVTPANEEEFFFQKALVLQEKIDTKEDSLKKLLVLQENTNDEESLIKQPLALQEHPNIEKEGLFKEPLAMQEKPSIEKEAVLKEPITDTEANFKKPLVLQEKPSIEKETIFKELLALQEKSTIEEKAIPKEPLYFEEKPSTDKETFFREYLALQKLPVMEEEAMLKDPLTLHEKPSIEKETLFKEHLALQEKPRIEKEAVPKEPLALQEKPSIEKEALSKELSSLQEAFLFKEVVALNEKLTTEKESSSKEPLALEEDPTCKEDTFLKTFLILPVETSPHVSSTAPESRIGKSSAATMSSVGKSSPPSKSSACESGSNKTVSLQGKRTQEEMTPLEDIEKDLSDPFFNSTYVKDIFSYMKEREEKFILKNYMNMQVDINSDMRAILVDWLVEVQMSFEMSHETLYLAVKLVDHYLMEVVCKKDQLQLLGSTAFLIAAKFEEPCEPCVDDFLYICDGTYQRHEMLTLEIGILKTLKFDINIPTAYHFLCRYARCVRASMKTLTLSRFICEMTLQEYDYIQERASKLAAGSLLLALYMKKLGHWAPALEYYSGYKTSELHPLVGQLNILLTFHSCRSLKTVYSKYSQQVFFEVTKIPPLDMLKPEEILNY
ncbi:G2/mitotic-specific cyclin-B3 isoform X2 [Cynocephalus volans]|uniref:G2/mitotic-specific cyclin-B3 isoform X2 n=1 Tax=Cynocephalus volans TaxID=110931 RepID=UPI002FCC31DD